MSLPTVELWTDGSGTTRGNPGGWACVLCFGPIPVTKELSGGAVDTTNNRMELTAAIKGLQALKRPCEVTVHTDSEYVGKAFPMGWVDRWKHKKWKGVKNPDLWRELIEAVHPHMVRWVWVPGHSGVEYNERCDKLAGARRKEIIEAAAAGTIHELKFEVGGYVGQLEMV